MNAQIVIDPQNDFCPGGALPGYVSSPDDVRCAICLCDTPCAGAQRCCNFCIGSLHIKQYVAAKKVSKTYQMSARIKARAPGVPGL